MPVLGAIDALPVRFLSIMELIKLVYEHEYIVIQEFNELAHVAMMLQNYFMFHFSRWYAAEQHEEEKILKLNLNKLKPVLSR